MTGGRPSAVGLRDGHLDFGLHGSSGRKQGGSAMQARSEFPCEQGKEWANPKLCIESKRPSTPNYLRNRLGGAGTFKGAVLLKVTIGQQALVDLVSDVGRAVATKTNIPVMCCVMLEAKGQVLSARGTDVETTVQRRMAATIETPGQIALPARVFGEVVRHLPAGELVVLEVNPQNWTTTITCGRVKTVVHGMSPEQYPPLIPLEALPVAEMQAETWRQLFALTHYAAAEDESKPWLRSVKVTMSPVQTSTLIITGIATNGARIAQYTAEVASTVAEPYTALVPAAASSDLCKRLGGHSGPVRAYLGPSVIAFEWLDTTMIVRLAEGQYPDMLRLLPKKIVGNAKGGVGPLLDALSRARIFCPKDKRGRIHFSPEGVTLEAGTPEVGSHSEPLLLTYHGEPVTIGMNLKFLEDAIEHAGAEELEIYLSGQRTAMTIQSMAKQVQAVVMPLMSF